MKFLAPYFVYALSHAILQTVAIISPPLRSLIRNQKMLSSSVLVIEAGERGWDSIEFKELYKSATEFLGSHSVHRLIVKRELDYLSQIKELITSNPSITHYLYDPRTYRAEGDQNFWNAIADSLSVAILLRRHGITPIAYLTNIGYRLWRCQAAIVTSKNGLVVSFMSAKFGREMFPHDRIVGPMIFPISLDKLKELSALRNDLERSNAIDKRVRFTGSIYEPRTQFLNEFAIKMQSRADIHGRPAGSVRKRDTEYWNLLASAAINITTADQVIEPGADENNIKHMVYRYLEVLASGSLLLAPSLPGIESYFLPNVHFVDYNSVDEACEKAMYYLENTEKANSIRFEGHKKARALIESNAFWLQINSALGPSGFY